jgi:hypothetical protein
LNCNDCSAPGAGLYLQGATKVVGAFFHPEKSQPLFPLGIETGTLIPHG